MWQEQAEKEKVLRQKLADEEDMRRKACKIFLTSSFNVYLWLYGRRLQGMKLFTWNKRPKRALQESF